MKKNMCKKTALLMATALMAGLALTGCGKEEETKVELPATEEMDTASEIELVNHDGMVQNDLNGEWITPEENDKKPLAVMINNVPEACPQSGIGQADVIYEMVVEGSITRLEAVFTDYSGITKLGPVRSARQYYVRNAEMLDAIFAHIGTSTLADAQIAQGKVDDMDGMGALGNYFIYRDNARVAPHNAYASEEGINEAIANGGFDTNHDGSYEPMFNFNGEDKDLVDGQATAKISVDFKVNHPWFEYDETEKVFKRFQFGGEQIDDQTNEQLTFKNLLFLYADTYSVDGYLMEVVNNTSGDGYYATNGSYIPISWKYELGTVHYYMEDGTELYINPGKTFITWYDRGNKEGITFE